MYAESLTAAGGRAVSEVLDERTTSRKTKSWYLRRLLSFGPDVTIFAVALTIAYLLRFDFEIPQQERISWMVQLPCVILIQFAALRYFGIHRFVWRYVGMAEMNSFLNAACLAFLPILALRLLLPQSFQQLRIPVSVIVMNTILAFVGALGVRVLRRAVYERYQRPGSMRSMTRLSKREKRSTDAKGKRAVLLIGAGRAGMLAAREILSRSDLGLEIKGFIDDDPNKLGSVIQGVEVLGTAQDLPRLVSELGVDHVVITVAHACRKKIRELVKICEQIPVKPRIVPGLDEIVGGNVDINPIRDLRIEDLLGREAVHLDEDEVKRFFLGKTVMVTGAGGSIGSELARQVGRFRPSRLLLVERAEFSLFHIDRELRQLLPDVSLVPLVADIGDEARMRQIFSTHLPQVVLHAAAHKHVPMMEFNISEAVTNNILGTQVLGELAGNYGAEVFILISTDKAVRPASAMGASKRIAELVVQNLNQHFATRYAAVRFGNVIGSAGSVIPIFREQIHKGGPVTVTHPDMMRYFMTIPEAAQLVIQAGTMAEGGEIFVLNMGEPVNIYGMAKDLITLSGLKPFEDIDIIFTGMRPGEKLFEELETTDEHLTKTRHPKIFIGKIATFPEEYVRHSLRSLAKLSKSGQEDELRRFLSQILPEAQLDQNSRVEAYVPKADSRFAVGSAS